MNTIKNSFSNIKASDEFKDKLFKELQAVSMEQKHSINDNISNSKVLNPSNNKRESLSYIKIYYKQYIAATAIFCVLIGIVGSKLALIGVQKESETSEIIAYEPQTEPATGKDHIAINSSENNDKYEESKTEPSYKNIDAVLKNNNGDLENERSSKSYVKGEAIINNTVESKNSSTTIKENINDNKSITDSDKKIAKTDTTLKTDEAALENAKASSSDLATIANYPETHKDAPPLTRSIKENINLDETASISSINIPKYELPKTVTYAAKKMMPLIIYKGNIYLHSNVNLDSKDVKNILGKKLGTTQNSIDEWNSEKNNSIDLASNIGITDVYTVNGYDEGFRLMTNYKSEDGTNTADIYECLNGITISNGNDILSKLNLKDNISIAKFESYSDWNNGTNIYHKIDNINLINDLLNEIEKGTPYLPENIEDSLGDYRNDNECKELSFDLKDGTKNITFTILKSGYVYYGYPKIYFKIDSNFTKEFWNKINS
ncbi:hypothetical protein [Clostridium sp. C2-6-12]|uniref:hypothetical protein n=1 Tax=Clostridium sp. C2-6-12 TaxID=2698832 RepID=UPI00136B86F5|nr:hypothetical protein [Clostridium sp. C2-6-12]